MTTIEGIFWLRIIYPNYVFSVDFQAEKGVRIVCKCVLYSPKYVIYKETQNEYGQESCDAFSSNDVATF